MYSTTNASSHKFQTINAALTAALALNPKPAIIVYPGTYTATNLYGNGINYYFYPGASVTKGSSSEAIFHPLAPGETCRVFGNGDFDGGLAPVSDMDQATSILYLQGNNLQATADTIVFSDGIQVVDAVSIISLSNSAVELRTNESASEVNTLSVKALAISGSTSVSTNGTINLSAPTTGFKGDVKMVADRISSIGVGPVWAEVS